MGLVGSCNLWLGCGWENKHGPSEYLGHSGWVVGVTLPQGKACDDKVWLCLYLYIYSLQ